MRLEIFRLKVLESIMFSSSKLNFRWLLGFPHNYVRSCLFLRSQLVYHYSMVIGSNIVLFILYLSLVTSEPVNVMLYSEMYIIIPFSRSDGSYKNLLMVTGSSFIACSSWSTQVKRADDVNLGHRTTANEAYTLGDVDLSTRTWSLIQAQIA